MILTPSISPEIFALRPDFTALSISVTNARNTLASAETAGILNDACRSLDWAEWAEDHLGAWDDAYRAFGAKPKRTPCSATALRKRAASEPGLPSINAVVDLYNAISVKFALPVGGEDAQSYQGSPRLMRASGDEPFETVEAGQAKIDHPNAGEVVWCDDYGVTCRRWNWRQGPRTQITEMSTSLWFVLERLDPMPLEALLDAGRLLVCGLQSHAAAEGISMSLADREAPEGRDIPVER